MCLRPFPNQNSLGISQNCWRLCSQVASWYERTASKEAQPRSADFCRPPGQRECALICHHQRVYSLLLPTGVLWIHSLRKNMPTAETQKTSLEVFFLRGRTATQLPLCECTSILLVIIPSRACELTRAIYTRSRTRGGAGWGGRQRENKRMSCSRRFILPGMPPRMWPRAQRRGPVHSELREWTHPCPRLVPFLPSPELYSP